MIVALLLALAEVPASPLAEAASPSGECAPQASDEVVVCGSRKGPSPYRLPKVPNEHASGPKRAAVQIVPGVELSVNAGSSALPGAQGVGLMAKMKIKF